MSGYQLLGVCLAAAQAMAAIAIVMALPTMRKNNTLKEGMFVLCITLATAIFIFRAVWLA